MYYGGMAENDNVFRAVCKRNTVFDNRLHSKLKEYADQHGVKIYNAIPGGWLCIFKNC